MKELLIKAIKIERYEALEVSILGIEGNHDFIKKIAEMALRMESESKSEVENDRPL